MSNRSILTISPQAFLWKKEGDRIIINHFFTNRKVTLEKRNAFLWELILYNSDYQEIKAKFLEKHSEGQLNILLKGLKHIGLIKIYYDY